MFNLSKLNFLSNLVVKIWSYFHFFRLLQLANKSPVDFYLSILMIAKNRFSLTLFDEVRFACFDLARNAHSQSEFLILSCVLNCGEN